MLQKKNEGILFSAEIRVVGSYTDRLLIVVLALVYSNSILIRHKFPLVVMEERRTRNVQRKTVKGQRRVFHGKLSFLE